MLEMLAVLAILALVTGVAAASLRAPSPQLQLDTKVAAFKTEAAALRHRAVTQGIRLEMPAADCDGQPIRLLFHPDGTAHAATVCLSMGPLDHVLRLSPLSGRLLDSDAP